MESNNKDIIFKSTLRPFKIFIFGLVYKIFLFFIFFIILPLFNLSRITERGYVYCIFIFFALIFIQSVIQFKQKKTYIYAIFHNSEYIVICYNILFKKTVLEFKILKNEKSLRLNIRESFFPIPTSGNSVSKLEFIINNDRELIQYEIGDWSRKEMLRVKAEIEALIPSPN